MLGGGPLKRSVDVKNRIDSLDVVRGLALCGIIFVNAPPVWHLEGSRMDGQVTVVRSILDLFVQQRFFPIFSLLFGIGFGMMWTITRVHSARPRAVMLRRIGFLAALGAVHQLLQPGEALLTYAIVALLFLMPLTYIPYRWQMRLAASGGILAVAAPLTTSGGVALIPGLFLLGFAGGRCDVARAVERHRSVVVVVTMATVPIAITAAWWQLRHPLDVGFNSASAVAGLVMACGYTGLTLLAMGTRLRDPLIRVLSPLGRMALTNYLGATVAMWALMPLRPLLGLDTGTVSAWTRAMALCVVILVAQWFLSAWWLGRHPQGPLEAVWRTVTWGRRQVDVPAAHSESIAGR